MPHRHHQMIRWVAATVARGYDYFVYLHGDASGYEDRLNPSLKPF